MIIRNLLLCVVLTVPVIQIHGLVQLKTSLANSDNPLLTKILQSIDAATSDEHLFEVTLKLLKSLCACMRDTLKAKEDRYNNDKTLVGVSESINTEGKVIDLYKKIYNNTCFNLRQVLPKRNNRSNDTWNNPNCGKDYNEKPNAPENEAGSRIVKNVLMSKLDHILYRALVQTRHHHKYKIKKYNLFGKAKSRVKSSPKHTLIVILTLHPSKQDLGKYNVVEEDLHKILHENSTIEIDIIDTRYDQKEKESEEAPKTEMYSDCHLQSLYIYLTESEKKNLTKVFRFLRRRDTIKIYIEVFTGRNHSDYINICCENGTMASLCKKDLIESPISQEDVQYKKLDKEKSMAMQNDFKNTITKLKNLVKKLRYKPLSPTTNDFKMNVTYTTSESGMKHDILKGIFIIKENNSNTDQTGPKANSLPNLEGNLTHPIKLRDVSRAIILLNDFVSNQTPITNNMKSYETNQTDYTHTDIMLTLGFTEDPFTEKDIKTSVSSVVLDANSTIAATEIYSFQDTTNKLLVAKQNTRPQTKDATRLLTFITTLETNAPITTSLTPTRSTIHKNLTLDLASKDMDIEVNTRTIATERTLNIFNVNKPETTIINDLQKKQPPHSPSKLFFSNLSTLNDDMNIKEINYTKIELSTISSIEPKTRHVLKKGSPMLTKTKVENKERYNTNNQNEYTRSVSQRGETTLETTTGNAFKHTTVLSKKMDKTAVLKLLMFPIQNEMEQVTSLNISDIQHEPKLGNALTYNTTTFTNDSYTPQIPKIDFSSRLKYLEQLQSNNTTLKPISPSSPFTNYVIQKDAKTVLIEENIDSNTIQITVEVTTENNDPRLTSDLLSKETKDLSKIHKSSQATASLTSNLYNSHSQMENTDKTSVQNFVNLSILHKNKFTDKLETDYSFILTDPDKQGNNSIVSFTTEKMQSHLTHIADAYNTEKTTYSEKMLWDLPKISTTLDTNITHIKLPTHLGNSLTPYENLTDQGLPKKHFSSNKQTKSSVAPLSIFIATNKSNISINYLTIQSTTKNNDIFDNNLPYYDKILNATSTANTEDDRAQIYNKLQETSRKFTVMSNQDTATLYNKQNEKKNGRNEDTNDIILDNTMESPYAGEDSSLSNTITERSFESKYIPITSIPITVPFLKLLDVPTKHTVTSNEINSYGYTSMITKQVPNFDIDATTDFDNTIRIRPLNLSTKKSIKKREQNTMFTLIAPSYNIINKSNESSYLQSKEDLFNRITYLSLSQIMPTETNEINISTHDNTLGPTTKSYYFHETKTDAGSHITESPNKEQRSKKTNITPNKNKEEIERKIMTPGETNITNTTITAFLAKSYREPYKNTVFVTDFKNQIKHTIANKKDTVFQNLYKNHITENTTMGTRPFIYTTANKNGIFSTGLLTGSNKSNIEFFRDVTNENEIQNITTHHPNLLPKNATKIPTNSVKYTSPVTKDINFQESHILYPTENSLETENTEFNTTQNSIYDENAHTNFNSTKNYGHANNDMSTKVNITKTQDITTNTSLVQKNIISTSHSFVNDMPLDVETIFTKLYNFEENQNVLDTTLEQRNNFILTKLSIGEHNEYNINDTIPMAKVTPLLKNIIEISENTTKYVVLDPEESMFEEPHKYEGAENRIIHPTHEATNKNMFPNTLETTVNSKNDIANIAIMNEVQDIGTNPMFVNKHKTDDIPPDTRDAIFEKLYKLDNTENSIVNTIPKPSNNQIYSMMLNITKTNEHKTIDVENITHVNNIQDKITSTTSPRESHTKTYDNTIYTPTNTKNTMREKSYDLDESEHTTYNINYPENIVQALERSNNITKSILKYAPSNIKDTTFADLYNLEETKNIVFHTTTKLKNIKTSTKKVNITEFSLNELRTTENEQIQDTTTNPTISQNHKMEMSESIINYTLPNTRKTMNVENYKFQVTENAIFDPTPEVTNSDIFLTKPDFMVNNISTIDNIANINEIQDIDINPMILNKSISYIKSITTYTHPNTKTTVFKEIENLNDTKSNIHKLDDVRSVKIKKIQHMTTIPISMQNDTTETSDSLVKYAVLNANEAMPEPSYNLKAERINSIKRIQPTINSKEVFNNEIEHTVSNTNNTVYSKSILSDDTPYNAAVNTVNSDVVIPNKRTIDIIRHNLWTPNIVPETTAFIPKKQITINKIKTFNDNFSSSQQEPFLNYISTVTFPSSKNSQNQKQSFTERITSVPNFFAHSTLKSKNVLVTPLSALLKTTNKATLFIAKPKTLKQNIKMMSILTPATKPKNEQNFEAWPEGNTKKFKLLKKTSVNIANKERSQTFSIPNNFKHEASLKPDNVYPNFTRRLLDDHDTSNTSHGLIFENSKFEIMTIPYTTRVTAQTYGESTIQEVNHSLISKHLTQFELHNTTKRLSSTYAKMVAMPTTNVVTEPNEIKNATLTPKTNQLIYNLSTIEPDTFQLNIRVGIETTKDEIQFSLVSINQKPENMSQPVELKLTKESSIPTRIKQIKLNNLETTNLEKSNESLNNEILTRMNFTRRVSRKKELKGTTNLLKPPSTSSIKKKQVTVTKTILKTKPILNNIVKNVVERKMSAHNDNKRPVIKSTTYSKDEEMSRILNAHTTVQPIKRKHKKIVIKPATLTDQFSMETLKVMYQEHLRKLKINNTVIGTMDISKENISNIGHTDSTKPPAINRLEEQYNVDSKDSKSLPKIHNTSIFVRHNDQRIENKLPDHVSRYHEMLPNFTTTKTQIFDNNARNINNLNLQNGSETNNSLLLFQDDNFQSKFTQNNTKFANDNHEHALETTKTTFKVIDDQKLPNSSTISQDILNASNTSMLILDHNMENSYSENATTSTHYLVTAESDKPNICNESTSCDTPNIMKAENDKQNISSGSTSSSLNLVNSQNKTIYSSIEQNKVSEIIDLTGSEKTTMILGVTKALKRKKKKYTKSNKSSTNKRRKLINALKYKHNISNILRKLVKTKKLEMNKLNVTDKKRVINRLLSKLRRPTIHVNITRSPHKSSTIPIKSSNRDENNSSVKYNTQIDKPTRKSYFSYAPAKGIELISIKNIRQHYLKPTNIIPEKDIITRSLNSSLAMNSEHFLLVKPTTEPVRTSDQNFFWGIKSNEFNETVNYTNSYKFLQEMKKYITRQIPASTFEQIGIRDKITKLVTLKPITVYNNPATMLNSLTVNPVSKLTKQVHKMTEFIKSNIIGTDQKPHFNLNTSTTGKMQPQNKKHYINININIPYLTLHAASTKNINNMPNKIPEPINTKKYTKLIKFTHITEEETKQSSMGTPSTTRLHLLLNNTKQTNTSLTSPSRDFLPIVLNKNPKIYNITETLSDMHSNFNDLLFSKDIKTNTESINKQTTHGKELRKISKITDDDSHLRRHVSVHKTSVKGSLKQIVENVTTNKYNQIIGEMDNKLTQLHKTISVINNYSLIPNISVKQNVSDFRITRSNANDVVRYNNNVSIILNPQYDNLKSMSKEFRGKIIKLPQIKEEVYTTDKTVITYAPNNKSTSIIFRDNNLILPNAYISTIIPTKNPNQLHSSFDTTHSADIEENSTSLITKLNMLLSPESDKTRPFNKLLYDDSSTGTVYNYEITELNNLTKGNNPKITYEISSIPSNYDNHLITTYRPKLETTSGQLPSNNSYLFYDKNHTTYINKSEGEIIPNIVTRAAIGSNISMYENFVLKIEYNKNNESEIKTKPLLSNKNSLSPIKLNNESKYYISNLTRETIVVSPKITKLHNKVMGNRTQVKSKVRLNYTIHSPSINMEKLNYNKIAEYTANISDQNKVSFLMTDNPTSSHIFTSINTNPVDHVNFGITSKKPSEIADKGLFSNLQILSLYTTQSSSGFVREKEVMPKITSLRLNKYQMNLKDSNKTAPPNKTPNSFSTIGQKQNSLITEALKNHVTKPKEKETVVLISNIGNLANDLTEKSLFDTPNENTINITGIPAFTTSYEVVTQTTTENPIYWFTAESKSDSNYTQYSVTEILSSLPIVNNTTETDVDGRTQSPTKLASLSSKVPLKQKNQGDEISNFPNTTTEVIPTYIQKYKKNIKKINDHTSHLHVLPLSTVSKNHIISQIYILDPQSTRNIWNRHTRGKNIKNAIIPNDTKIYQDSLKINPISKLDLKFNRVEQTKELINPHGVSVTTVSHKLQFNLKDYKNKRKLINFVMLKLESNTTKTSGPQTLSNDLQRKQILKDFFMRDSQNKIYQKVPSTLSLANNLQNETKTSAHYTPGLPEYVTSKIYKDNNASGTSTVEPSNLFLPTPYEKDTDTNPVSTGNTHNKALEYIFTKYTNLKDSKSIEGNNLHIYSSRLNRQRFLQLPTHTVTKNIKYNTYQPPIKEDFESPKRNRKLSPRSNTSCAILKTLRHKFNSAFEFTQFLKASNCTLDNLNIHINIKNNRFNHVPVKANGNKKMKKHQAQNKHPSIKLTKKVYTKLGSRESLLNSYEKTKLFPVKAVKALPPKIPPGIVKRINIGRRKEIMSMNTHDFFSQHRLATIGHLNNNIKLRSKNLYFRAVATSNPRQMVLRPKFDPLESAWPKFDKPRTFFLRPRSSEEIFPDSYEVHNHDKIPNRKQNIGTVAALQNNVGLLQKQVDRIANVLDRPLTNIKTDWNNNVFEEKNDLSKKKLWGPPDFVKITRPHDIILKKPVTPSGDQYNPLQLHYRRNNKVVTPKLAPITPMRTPTPRRRRTIFFLSPTVTDWWLNDMYLKVRLPLPINSNPGMVFPRRHFAKMEEVADLGALFIDDILDYKEMLDRGELPLERATSREKGQPLCMEQFYRLLGVCRIPEVGKDRLELPLKAGPEEQEELVVVACRNYFYPIPVKAADRGRLTPGEIQAQLLHAMVDAAGAPPAPRVGLLTSTNRDQWARAREHLIKDEMNRMNLELISRALCILCLDEAGGDRADTDPETNAMLRAMHGAGTRHHSANRWFDKTVQLIISSDGTVGMCYEHSAAEGVAVVRLAERALARAEVADRPAPPPALLPAPLAMKWNITPDVQRNIEQAARDLDRAISDLDFKIYTYRGYGREFMKSCRTSPDVYIQLAIQYAYYKMYGYLVTTYESASLRRFRQGRVDNIRSAHGAALAWAAAMCTAETSPLNDGTDEGQKKVSFNLYGEQKKLELFEDAARKQTSIMEANILGKGIDNHLLGLREMARETLGELPPVFCDDAYKQMFEFKMSTSQVTTTTDGTYMGYGAVCPDGYGCCYNPKKDSIIFCISSFTSSSVTNTEAYRQSLEEALDSMKLMFQARKVDN